MLDDRTVNHSFRFGKYSCPMNTVGQRIKKKREERGLSVPDLAKTIGISRQAMYDIESGATKSPTADTLFRLADALGANARELSTGKPAPHLVSEPESIYGRNIEAGPDITGSVPLISWVRAGQWSESIDLFAPGDAEKWYPCPVSHGPRTFVLRVRGESMFNPTGEKSFREGDLIFVDPDREAVHRSLVVVRLDDSKEATFKQLFFEGERSYLKALNPGWPEQAMQINGNATIVGVVIFKGQEL